MMRSFAEEERPTVDAALLHAIIDSLPWPVARKADDIAALIRSHAVCGIGGEAGSGKSSLVPLIAAAAVPGKVIVVEPRRLSAVAVSRWLNELHSRAGGGRIAGYAVRYDRDERPHDAILCVTTGVFLHLLAADPSLAEFGTVILDEIHERGLESDLGWALARSALDLYRTDLKLIVMSASVGEELLDGTGPRRHGWLTVPGRIFPVAVEYRPPRRGTDEVLHWAAGATEALTRTEGDILVFLPGEREIRAVRNRLFAFEKQGITIHALYGRMDPREQKSILQKTGTGRRIILATNIAQTSLTIEGISCVIDSGLEKNLHHYPGEAAARLVTERISASSALQRTGRAGRLGPGLCLRLWDEREKLAPQDTPALYREDNTRLVLELARWGDIRVDRYRWLSPPDPVLYRSACEFLESHGLMDEAGRLTKKGSICAASSLPPGIASAVFDSETALQKTSLLCAGLLLDERGPRSATGDLALHSPQSLMKIGRLAAAAEKEARLFGFVIEKCPHTDYDAAALICNFPAAVALRGCDLIYVLSGGPALKLPATPPAPEALIVLRADHKTAVGVIHQYLSLDLNRLMPALKSAARTEEALLYEKDRMAFSAVKRECFGSLVLSETRLAPERLSHFAASFYRLLEKEGPAILPWDDRSRLLRERIACLKAAATDDARLIQAVRALYGDTLKSPAEIRLEDVLLSLVTPSLRRTILMLDEKRYRLSNGRLARIRYERDGRIVISARLQDFFGVRENPVIAGAVAAAELLSPAGRPLHITSDLAGFWKTGYQAVRKEMAGRYPKHRWPLDPLAGH